MLPTVVPVATIMRELWFSCRAQRRSLQPVLFQPRDDGVGEILVEDATKVIRPGNFNDRPVRPREVVLLRVGAEREPARRFV